MDTMYFGPLPDTIEHSPNLEMPQFSLVGTKHRDCSMNYTSGIYASSHTDVSFTVTDRIKAASRSFSLTCLVLLSRNVSRSSIKV